MTDIQRYEPWPQEWPQEDANGDLVLYEDHIKVTTELVEATLDAAHNYLVEQYGNSPLSHPVDRARILTKIKETTK